VSNGLPGPQREPLAAIEPGQCAVCRRPEEGAGWARKSWSGWDYATAPVLWVCNECIPLARKVSEMTKETRLRLELEAHELAVDDIANWMVETGQGPDLSNLSRADFEDVFANYQEFYGRRIRERFGA
jgi:hypothetical protein